MLFRFHNPAAVPVFARRLFPESKAPLYVHLAEMLMRVYTERLVEAADCTVPHTPAVKRKAVPEVVQHINQAGAGLFIMVVEHLINPNTLRLSLDLHPVHLADPIGSLQAP